MDKAPFLTGAVDIEANAVWDATGAGREWGSFVETLDAGGTWEGTFEGSRTPVAGGCSGFPCWKEELKLVGHGTDGIVDGMHFQGAEEILNFGGAFTSEYDLRFFGPQP